MKINTISKNSENEKLISTTPEKAEEDEYKIIIIIITSFIH